MADFVPETKNGIADDEDNNPKTKKRLLSNQ